MILTASIKTRRKKLQNFLKIYFLCKRVLPVRMSILHVCLVSKETWRKASGSLELELVMI